MNQVLQCTNDLANAIMQSDAYQNYNNAKEVIEKDLELGMVLNEYRKEIFKLQECASAEEYFERLDLLEKKYYGLKKDSRVMNFLASELQLSKMIREINETIVKLVDLELKL